jgi:hypothetical protein
VRRALAGALAAAAIAGSAAAARPVDPLPRTGLAVETERGVALVSLEGRTLRTLPGYRFRGLGLERPGQVGLRDGTGRQYVLRAGAITPVGPGEIPLAGGYALRFRGGRSLLLRGRTVERFPPFTPVALDDRGLVLSAGRSARDLVTGERLALPRGCQVGAARRAVRFELCGRSIVRVGADGRRELTGAPGGAAGHWRSVALSGGWLLAQWSGECEVPAAFLVDARTGRTTEVAGGVEALALGWAGDAALVSLLHGACGRGMERPGLYAIRGDRARLLHPLARAARAALWR